jgi:hypothetical protein
MVFAAQPGARAPGLRSASAALHSGRQLLSGCEGKDSNTYPRLCTRNMYISANT